MSTYMYLQCLEHDPPLRSNGEVGQHAYDLKDIRKYIANREAICALLEADIPIGNSGVGTFWANNASWFLYEHQKCEIGIINEYGGTYLTGLDDPEDEIPRETNQVVPDEPDAAG
jgi:hypothetical protein